MRELGNLPGVTSIDWDGTKTTVTLEFYNGCCCTPMKAFIGGITGLKEWLMNCE